MSIDINTLREVVTVVSLVTFVGILAWVVSARNKARFEAAARLPFEEGDAP